MSARGERTIQVGKNEVRVLFTNRAVAEAEKTLGKGILGVLQGFSDGRSGISDVAILLQCGMEAARTDAREGGKRVQLSDAYAVLDEVGFGQVTGPVMEAVAAVLSYDGQANGQAENADPN
jgi:hypothetical protein